MDKPVEMGLETQNPTLPDNVYLPPGWHMSKTDEETMYWHDDEFQLHGRYVFQSTFPVCICFGFLLLWCNWTTIPNLPFVHLFYRFDIFLMAGYHLRNGLRTSITS